MIRHLLLAATLFATPAGAARVTDYQARVVAVHDGDTVTVLVGRTQTKCRLLNIDAPELAMPHGQDAKKALSALVFARDVKVEDHGTEKWGRHLCVLNVGTLQANAEMVRQGWAWVYTQFNSDRTLPALEAEARAAHRGLWADANPISPWVWRRHH